MKPKKVEDLRDGDMFYKGINHSIFMIDSNSRTKITFLGTKFNEDGDSPRIEDGCFNNKQIFFDDPDYIFIGNVKEA